MFLQVLLLTSNLNVEYSQSFTSKMMKIALIALVAVAAAQPAFRIASQRVFDQVTTKLAKPFSCSLDL